MSLISQINSYIFIYTNTHIRNVNSHSSALFSVATLHSGEEWMFWVGPALFKFQLHYLLAGEHTSYISFNFAVPQCSHLEARNNSSYVIG